MHVLTKRSAKDYRSEKINRNEFLHAGKQGSDKHYRTRTWSAMVEYTHRDQAQLKAAGYTMQAK